MYLIDSRFYLVFDGKLENFDVVEFVVIYILYHLQQCKEYRNKLWDYCNNLGKSTNIRTGSSSDNRENEIFINWYEVKAKG